MVADYGTKALQGKPFSNHWSFIMNLPQVSADVKAVCHMMRARDQLPWEVESDSNDSKEEDVYDTGPSAVDDLRWTDDPNLRTGEYLLDPRLHIIMETHFKRRLFTKYWFPRCLSSGLGIVRMVVPSSVQDRRIVGASQSGISFMAIAGSVYGLVA